MSTQTESAAIPTLHDEQSIMHIDLPDGSWLSRVGPLSLWALYNKEYVRMLNRFESEFVDAAIAAGATAEQSETLPDCISPLRAEPSVTVIKTTPLSAVMVSPAVEIAKYIRDVDSDHRHLLYARVADELVKLDQNYQASHFRALAKAERGTS